MSLRKDNLLPIDGFKYLADCCTEVDQFVTLSRLCRDANIGSQLSSQFVFFRSHYSYVKLEPQMGFHLLDLDKLTAANVRKGNQLVLEAIKLYLSGRFHDAEVMFTNAMCNHGSSVAMTIISSLSQYPGRVMLNIAHIIKRYKQQENKVLTAEIKQYFDETQYHDCFILCRDASNDLLYYNQGSFLKAVKELWDSDKGISLANIEKLGQLYAANRTLEFQMDITNDQWLDVDRVNNELRLMFDARGFLGLQAPRDGSWYMTTEEHLLSTSGMSPG